MDHMEFSMLTSIEIISINNILLDDGVNPKYRGFWFTSILNFTSATLVIVNAYFTNITMLK